MTFTQRLKSSAAGFVRSALGIGFAVALVAQPSGTFAQTAPAVSPAIALKATPQAQGSGPALWVIRDADSTLYLFGTVHVLRPTTAWGSARVDAAFDSADEIWFEISNPDDQAAVMPLVQRYGLSPDRPLSFLLTPAELVALNAAASAAGLTAAQLDPFRPWLASLTLAVAPLTKAGYDPASGVELVLKPRAEAAGKPIKAFETIDLQIGFLAGLNEADQLAFLRLTLEAYEDAATELDQLVEAWATGDVAGIERVVTEMREESPAMYDILLVRRNTDWANQIQSLLAGSGTAFIAVGAAHLAGEDSVQALLEDRGVVVAAVQ
ncbi:TraB/GumN family protein [Brevundimonas sp.]|uniref:TraB/GumN family protein n=1 Tax=Brevundimonas sp. TaxID=1871086 RepID=UPI0035688595